jgi:hypothetical protein
VFPRPVCGSAPTRGAAPAATLDAMQARPGIDLYWLPLGAGGHVVRRCGRLYELAAARRAGRPARDLYHSALIATTAAGRFAIESAPVCTGDGAERGVVAEGVVGARLLGYLRAFRYELRCWRDGVIPDLAEAVASPVRLSDEEAAAASLVALAPAVPHPVWGRDDLRAGEMWNSNSYVAWLLERAGLHAAAVAPPPGGRAPGWRAGVVVARREAAGTTVPA